MLKEATLRNSNTWSEVSNNRVKLNAFSFVKRTLAVGAETYKLKVTVKNKGDDAYNAKLYVTIPKGIKIGRIFTLRDAEGEDVSMYVKFNLTN